MKRIIILAMLVLASAAFAHGGVDDGDLEMGANSIGISVTSIHMYHYLIAFSLVGIGMFGYYLYDKYRQKLK